MHNIYILYYTILYEILQITTAHRVNRILRAHVNSLYTHNIIVLNHVYGVKLKSCKIRFKRNVNFDLLIPK